MVSLAPDATSRPHTPTTGKPVFAGVVAALLCLPLAACGGSDTTTIPVATTAAPATSAPAPEPPAESEAPPAGGDACELLADLDLPTLMAETEVVVVKSDERDCLTGPADTTSTASIDLYVRAAGGGAYYDNLLDLYGADEMVPGLGEEAFRSGAFVVVRSGDSAFQLLTVRHPIDRPRLSADEQVAAARTVFDATGW